MSARAGGADERVELPAGLVQQLLPALRAMGYAGADVASVVPRVNIDLPVRQMGGDLGKLLCDAGLYRVGADLVPMAMRDGRFRVMTPVWFCSWVEKHAQVVRSGRNGDSVASMGKDLAAKLLETDELLRELPVVRQVVPVRSPVRRADGRVELLGAGYDRDAMVYCMDSVQFDEDWDVERALTYLHDLCKDMPFAESEGGGGLWRNRSFLAHIAGMVGVFCRLMLPPGTTRPLMLYTANDQGSGKSTLVAMALAAVFGEAANTDLPMASRGLNHEKFTALLETVAQSRQEYLWLDDVPQAVFSNSLNRFVTASRHTGRKYGGNDELFEVENVTQLWMTGNQVGVTRDILQRAMVVELYLSVDSQSRRFTQWITPHWLAEPQQRASMLAAEWALVRHWDASGRPMGSGQHGRAADWSRLVGGVLESCGVAADPFALPDLPMGGDEESIEWRKLLVALADMAENDEADPFDSEEEVVNKRYQVDMTAIVSKAREMHLLADILGGQGDKELKGSELKRVGRRLAKWRGREDLLSTSGRRFQFGKRKQSSNWVYPITWLDQ
jgi:hypothetical protein